ncbi:hypothetical protein FHJ30_15785 [Arthrobacter sp. BB-1]|uniref:hypothetical protein n=1 Tax=Micrococcaceae TaxID=1268 RepID=UPI0010D39D00|nr:MULTISPECIES: hypothetical protein [Micrococcaceae]TNB70282.1 hypothetical protein FHJ30_15785 [Arthrobacter sp. BB-1]UEL27835.1 hypothetical protein KTR40_14770 [Pseudarthrobacter sp. L1SW]VII97485.1 hypothetical protein [Arthrobacter sp. DR-2P]
MGFDPHEPEQRSRLNQALAAADVTAGELWLRYFGMSGSAGEYEVQAYLEGLLSLPPSERDLLAMAANELIREAPERLIRGAPPLLAPYADQLNGSTQGERSGSD